MVFSALSQLSDNTPPTLWMDNRDWILYENETIGSRVAQAHGDDAEGGPLEYGLEPIFYSNEKIPFRINPHTGTVYLNESLQGMVSYLFFLIISYQQSRDRSLHSCGGNVVIINIICSYVYFL